MIVVKNKGVYCLDRFIKKFEIKNSAKLNMIKEQDYIFKIVLVGNQGVGKSSLFLRFCDNNFIDNYLTTIGVDFRFRMLEVDDKVCKLQIWDTAGQ